MSDSPADFATQYDTQTLSERRRRGLTVNRRVSITMSHIVDDIWKAKKSGDPDWLSYGVSRNWLWQTRRQANARLAGKTNIHKQMLMCWSAVMLDLLADCQPTIKDLKRVTEKYGKQTRRLRKDSSHIVQNLDEVTEHVVYKQDGTCSATPLKPVRKSPKDNRIRKITTPYSSPCMLRDGFDLRVFADHAYIRRQRMFWEDALKHLSKWLKEGSAIRPDNAWIVYHIVNNDIAMHVIFDNLSLECEMNWFEGLGDKAKYEVAGRIIRKGSEMIPITKEESKADMDEMPNWIRTSVEPYSGERHALREGSKEFPIDYDKIRITMEVIVRLVRAMTDANGGLSLPVQEIEYVPYPLTEEDVRKAVDEMAAFVDGFEKKVPENLKKYMISQDRMRHRIRDVMLETIVELGMINSADEQLAADAIMRYLHKRFTC